MSVPVDVQFNDFVQSDNDMLTTGNLTDTEIVDALIQQSILMADGQDNEIDDSSQQVVPTHKEAIQALQTIENFLQTHAGFNEIHLTAVQNLHDEVIVAVTKMVKQTKITDYYK